MHLALEAGQLAGEAFGRRLGERIVAQFAAHFAAVDLLAGRLDAFKGSEPFGAVDLFTDRAGFLVQGVELRALAVVEVAVVVHRLIVDRPHFRDLGGALLFQVVQSRHCRFSI
ncbi:hypothetical protein L598_001500000400 [Mesorhizobium sp. J18]|uniref:hypothetical protein n=1 Tax=Mesorhizobium sp. J18 TaxID=935263 RepID=UPI00119B6E5E|nr:hypothetical protein [Mesorhizobium sp. J18]TWG99317.1 hypothetical protein L598_001500000400 [Mesorhizobium sp. J18]